MKKSKKLTTSLTIIAILLVITTIINKMYIISLVIGIALLIYLVYLYQSHSEGKAERSIETMFKNRD
ncbi:hypothetical protein [Clostridium baratii]|uniref:hypothetical protein n=1 Tax=Clostridium baratii TaxID=1561 RepID=UPI0005F2AD0B|nr:hypothetical protein [Clostridium baratii]KJU72384.1 hypothetical protein UC77_04430 [Clostridium baratii]